MLVLFVLLFIMFLHVRRAIIALHKRLTTRAWLFEEVFAGFFFGDDVGYFVGHGTAFASTAHRGARLAIAVKDFARAATYFGAADDATLFEKVDETGGTGIANAQTALEK